MTPANQTPDLGHFANGGSPFQGLDNYCSLVPGALPQAGMMPGRWPSGNWTLALAEHRRIVAKVEQLMALVDALETQLAAARATAANLLSALVTELTVARVPVPSANGAPPSQPGATPQVHGRKHDEG